MTHDEPTVPTEALSELAPSAKLVAKTLEYEGSLTQSRLAEETRLPARTVRHALNELESEGVVAARISFTDARKRIYTLEEEASDRVVAVDGER